MKIYEKPQMEIEKFDVSDIITVSGAATNVITGLADPETVITESFEDVLRMENWQ